MLLARLCKPRCLFLFACVLISMYVRPLVAACYLAPLWPLLRSASIGMIAGPVGAVAVIAVVLLLLFVRRRSKQRARTTLAPAAPVRAPEPLTGSWAGREGGEVQLALAHVIAKTEIEDRQRQTRQTGREGTNAHTHAHTHARTNTHNTHNTHACKHMPIA